MDPKLLVVVKFAHFFMFSDISSEDEDICEKVENYAELTVPMMSDKQFQHNFRITITCSEDLLRKCNQLPVPLNHVAHVGFPTSDKELMIAIWYLANIMESLGTVFRNAMEATRAAKTNSAQWAVLVDFLLQHPEMVTRAFVGLDARQNYRRLWDQVAAQLNAMGFGIKPTDKWIDENNAPVSAQNSGNEVETEASQNAEENPIIDFVIDLPELVPISSKKLSATASTSTTLEKTTNLLISSGSCTAEKDVAGIENKKRKLPSEIVKGKYKSKKIVNQRKSRDEMTLLRMHQETMGVLKDINQNLGRLADGQEAFLNGSNLCQGCLAKKPQKKTENTDNFHDYF